MPPSSEEPEMDEHVLLLVRLGAEGGGRVDPARIYRRKPTSHARIAYEEAQDAGLLDAAGYVTPIGYEALR